MNDYYTLYINNYLINTYNNIKLDEENIENENNQIFLNHENTKRFLELFVFIRNRSLKIENLTQKHFLANAINWLECYSFEITIILRVFSKLNNIIIDLYDQIESFIHIKLSLFKNSEEIINFSHKINEVFVLGIESMLNIITSNIDIYRNIINSQDKITQFINISKDILQDTKQLYTNLNIHTKEIYSFEEFI